MNKILSNNIKVLLLSALVSSIIDLLTLRSKGVFCVMIMFVVVVVLVLMNCIRSVVCFVKKDSNAKFYLLNIFTDLLIGYSACLGGAKLVNLIQR